MRWAWLGLQSLALLAILFTPLWIQSKRSETPSRVSDSSGGLINFDRASAEALSRKEPTSISSQVIPIQVYSSGAFDERAPASLMNEKRLEIESRQVRFEWSNEQFNSSDWKLYRIYRVYKDKSLNEVSLLADDRGVPIGSVYVELESQEDLFLVKMVNPKTKREHEIRFYVSPSARVSRNR